MTDDNEPGGTPKAANDATPLHRFSLRGMGSELEAEAVAKVPLLGDVCLSGDVTLWGAPANSGKTLLAIGLLADAIQQKLIDPDRCFYADMDDSMNGVAEKTTILQDYGVHVVAEGYKGFTSSMLPNLMQQMTADGTARGTLLIVDTLKKVADPMDKKKAPAFLKIARNYVLTGGTVLLLAHTNKQRAEGRLILAGVADLKDDVDTVYVLDRKEDGARQTVVFHNEKRRAGGALRSVYGCSNEPDISYVQRLTTIEHLGTDVDLAEFAEPRPGSPDDIAESIALAIHHGNVQKMKIVELVRMATKASKRAVLDVLEARTGPAADGRPWSFTVQVRGANVFALNRPAEEFREAA